jgi:hypothetical protein
MERAGQKTAPVVAETAEACCFLPVYTPNAMCAVAEKAAFGPVAQEDEDEDEEE